MKKETPLSVIIISWFNLIILLISIVLTVYVILSNTLSIRDIYSLITSIAAFIAAIALLKGFNWGRVVLLLYTPCSLLYSLISRHLSIYNIADVICFLAFLFFLTRSDVNKFLDNNLKNNSNDPSESILNEHLVSGKRKINIIRRVLGLAIFIFCYWFFEFFCIEPIILIILGSKFNLVEFITDIIFIDVILIIALVAVFIWEWRAWRELFAINFISFGILFLITTLYAPFIIMDPKVTKLLPILHSINAIIITIYFLICSCFNLIIGGLFYRSMKKKISTTSGMATNLPQS